MERLPENVMLKFNPDTLEAVRKSHGFESSSDIANAVEIFDTWIKQQNHFIKKDYDKEYLERLIITSKGSVERAKARLDNLCTMRTLLPQYFGDYDAKKDFKHLDGGVYTCCPMPQMTKSYERVFVLEVCGQKYDNDIFFYGYRNIAMFVEYLKNYDYAQTCVFLVDLRRVNMVDYISKIGLTEVREIMTLITDGYGLRLKAILLLTDSKLIETFINMVKQVLSEKIGGKFKPHRSLETVYEVIPKEVLPKEYGGNEIPLYELKGKWDDILGSEEFRNRWREMCAAKTDETCRDKHTFNNQYMGLPGTFRSLNVD